MEPDGTPTVVADGRTAPARGRRRVLDVVLLLLAALPALLGLAGLWAERDQPYVPISDQAILALVVEDVGQQQVLLGAYSRFGWHHPGPMGTYLLAGASYLLDGAYQALAAGTLVIGGISAVGAVWVVRRRAGALAAVWAVLVLAVSVHTLGGDMLRDSWNPHLPVLPLLLGVLLCWTAVRGDAWALPLAVVPLSLALQSHIGYLPPVGATVAVLAAGLLVRAVRRTRRRRGSATEPDRCTGRRPRRWLFATVAALALGLLLWLPPIVQQLTGTPGNVSLLVDYLRRGSPDAEVSLGGSLRIVADEFGRLPAYVVGAEVPDGLLIGLDLPAAATGLGLALFLAAIATGIHRRRADVAWLGVLTLGVAAAGVAAIVRIDGLPAAYLTQWTVVVGILAWTTVGVGLLPELVAALRRVRPARRARVAEALIGATLAVLATAAALQTGLATARAQTPQTEVTGALPRLEQAVVDDLDRRGLRTGRNTPVVRVDFAPTIGGDSPSRPGTFWFGSGLVLELVRDGVDVQVTDFWASSFGSRYTERADDAGYVVTLAYSGGASPPPEPWQRILLVAGDLQVYGGVLPTG